MANKPLPTPEELRQLLHYEPDTGKLFWKERPISLFKQDIDAPGRQRTAQKIWNTRYAGKEAFTAKSRGYHYGALFNRCVFAHRVIWAIHTGQWPEEDVDHINGNPADNRITNLRALSHRENLRNRAAPRNNTSGIVGVSAEQNGFVAYIGSFHLGRWATIEEAAAARYAAMRIIDYHHTHGRKAAATIPLRSNASKQIKAALGS